MARPWIHGQTSSLASMARPAQHSQRLLVGALVLLVTCVETAQLDKTPPAQDPLQDVQDAGKKLMRRYKKWAKKSAKDADNAAMTGFLELTSNGDGNFAVGAAQSSKGAMHVDADQTPPPPSPRWQLKAAGSTSVSVAGVAGDGNESRVEMYGLNDNSSCNTGNGCFWIVEPSSDNISDPMLGQAVYLKAPGTDKCFCRYAAEVVGDPIYMWTCQNSTHGADAYASENIETSQYCQWYVQQWHAAYAVDGTVRIKAAGSTRQGRDYACRLNGMVNMSAPGNPNPGMVNGCDWILQQQCGPRDNPTNCLYP